MALIQCKECKQQVSSKAEACPHCGAKMPKKTSLFTWIVAGIIAVAFIRIFTAGNSLEPAKKEIAETPKTSATPTKRDLQLQAGGAGALTLKRASKDPDTFELKTAVVKPDGATCYSYRAKNGFGAMLAGAAILTVAGKILVEEKDGNAFVSAWNKSCTKDGGDDITEYLRRNGLI